MIESAVREALLEVVPGADLDRLGPRDSLREALEIDSFDFLRFLTSLEDRLGVAVPEDDYGALATLADVVAYVEERRER